MRWFRSHLRSGASLALFALTVQLVLSFAHVHVPGASPAMAGAKLAALLGMPASADTATTPATPSKPQPNGLIGDTCAICALIQMAGAAPPAASANLPLPLVVGQITQVIRVGRALEAPPHSLAQARAPPIA
jgi:hypothetical protein